MSWIEYGIWNEILMCMETFVLTLCTWFFMSRTEQDQNEKKKYRWGAAILYWMGLAGITFGFQDSRSVHLILLVYMVFMTMLAGRLLYNRGRIYRFYYFLFPVTMVTIRIFVIYMVFAYMSSRWGSMIFDYALTNTALVIRQLTEILLTGAWVVVLNRKKYENVKGMQFAGLFLAPAVSVFIIFSLIYTGDVFVQMYGAFLIILNILALVIMNLYIWYLFSYQSKNKKLRAELEIRKKQSEMQYQYYEKVEQRYQSSRKMVHDMRNHLQAIEALQEQDADKGREYVKDMHRMLESFGIVNYTENRMLNIVLNDKAEEAQKSGIGMEIRIDEIRLEHIRDMDMTTIFANLLDNALEAAEQVVGKRMIQVQADTFHDFTVVKIRNSMACGGAATGTQSPQMEMGDAVENLEEPDVQLMSQEDESQTKQGIDALEQKEKKGRKSHMGIGLENVRHTLEKYGGGMMTEALEGEFVVSITIPE